MKQAQVPACAPCTMAKADALRAARCERLFSLNPSLLPLSLLRRHASLVKSPAVVAVAKRLMWLLKTRKPKARLRLIEFRGVSSAAMVYDALPVIDIFRKVDADTVLGLMDVRGEAPPAWFYFILRREREPATPRRP